MWTVIYIAPTTKIAERIQRNLQNEGFLVELRPISISKQQYEVLVPATEVDEVQEVLSHLLNQ